MSGFSIAAEIDRATVYLQAIKDHLAAEERLAAAAEESFEEWRDACEGVGQSLARLHDLVEVSS